MTVNELLDQHNKVLRAKADLDDVNFLYPPEEGGAGLHESFYELALKKYLAATKLMKEMMAKAAPDVLAEAKRIAVEQKATQKSQTEDT